MIHFLKMLPKKDRVLLYISITVKIAILIALISGFFQGNIMIIGFSFIALVISFLPSIIRRTFKIVLPPEFEVLFALFLYGSIILGEIKNYYSLFPWWDLMLHILAGIMIGILGFMIIYSLYVTEKVVFAPIFAALFCFCLAMTIGVFWELFEYFMDSVFGWNMLKSGLPDTMLDLIVTAIGGLVISISGYFYMKGGDSFFMERFVKKFIALNKKKLDGASEKEKL